MSRHDRRRRRERDRKTHAIRSPAPRDRSVSGRFLERRGTWIVAVLIAASTALYSTLCLIKLRYYLYGDFDLAIFTQAADRLLRGSLESSVRGLNWLGDHSSLNLFLLAPLYAVWRDPAVLLVVQTGALAMGALPVYWLARRELPGGWAPLALAAAYLANPAVGYTNLFEFHPEALATGPLLFAFYFLRIGRMRPTFLWTGVALLAKEDVALVVLGMALYALRDRRPGRGRLALGLGLLAVASLVISFAVLKPLFGGDAVTYARLYQEWGDSPARILGNLLRDPGRAVAALFESPGDPLGTAVKRQYWAHLLLPVALLPLLSPLTLLVALPIVAEHFLAWRIQQHTIVFHYTALVTPFVFAAAVLGLRNALRWVAPVASARSERWAFAAAAVTLVCALGTHALFGPLGTGRFQIVRAPEPVFPTSHDRALAPVRDRMVDRIGDAPAVIAGFEFLAHLVRRPELHSLNHVSNGTYGFSSHPYPTPAGVEALVADMAHERVLADLDLESAGRLRRAIEVNRLAVAEVGGDLVLFRRDQPAQQRELVTAGVPPAGQLHGITYDRQLEWLSHEPVRAQLVAGGQVDFRTYWRRSASIDRLYFMRLRLADANGRTVFRHLRPIGYALLPPHDWPPSATVREVGRLVLPADLEPGVYTLDATIEWRGPQGEAGESAASDPSRRVVALGHVEVVRAERR
jgi:uncharacterized membrane protein